MSGETVQTSAAMAWDSRGESPSGAQPLWLKVADYAYIAGLMAVAIFPASVALSIVFLSALIPVILRFRSVLAASHDRVTLGMLLAQAILFAAAYWVHPADPGVVLDDAARPDFWLLVGLFSVVMYLRISLFDGLGDKIAVAVPIGLVVILGFLIFDRQSEVFGTACRVKGAAEFPFNAALVSACFSLVFVAMKPRISASVLWVMLAGVAVSAAIISGLTISRGILVAFCGSVALAALSFLIWRRPGWLIAAVGLPLAVAIGFVGVKVVNDLAPCGQMSTIQNVVQTVKTGEVPVEAEAITHRLNSWQVGLQMIKDAPIIGTGRWNEYAEMLEKTSLPHAHLQYISWLIWLGILGLIAGLAFLAFPMPTIFANTTGLERALLIVPLCVLPIALFFDSFLVKPPFLGFQAAFGCLLIAYARGIGAGRHSKSTAALGSGSTL